MMSINKLGRRQREWVDWALDPMADHWCTEDGARARDGALLDESELPRLEGSTLILGTLDEVNDDLLYRLEVQAPDVAAQDGDDCGPPLQVAKRIRLKFGM